MSIVIKSNESSSSGGINFYQKSEIFDDLATLDRSMTNLRADEPEYFINHEKEPQPQELVSNYHAVAIERAEQLTSPDMVEAISQVVTEIDRQGIDSFTTFEFENGKWPVSVVSVTDIFREVFQKSVTQNELSPEQVLANAEKQPKKRSTVIIPGFSPPPVGHPFTPWDYVYNQVFTDLPRLFNAYKKGEPLPEIDVRVLGSANSDWGEVTPEFLEKVQEKGFGAHGEMVADYLQKNLLEGNDDDYVRVNGISIGSLIATEAMDKIMTNAEHKKLKEILGEFGLLDNLQATYLEMLKEIDVFDSGRVDEVLQRMGMDSLMTNNENKNIKEKLGELGLLEKFQNTYSEMIKEADVFASDRVEEALQIMKEKSGSIEGAKSSSERMMNEEEIITLAETEGLLAAQRSLDKMQFVLDNPADQYYTSRLLKMVRAVQLPLGMGLDFAQVLARLPHYGKVYGGEPAFLEKFNKLVSEKRKENGESGAIPSKDEEQMSLKKRSFIAECLWLLKQPTADLTKRVFIRKGNIDFTTATFGDVMFSVVNIMGKRKLFRKLGRGNLATLERGHQRENFDIPRWVRTIQRGINPEEARLDLEQRVEQRMIDKEKVPKWKKFFRKMFV